MSWRRSKAFEVLCARILLVTGFGTIGGMSLLVLLKRNGDFGAKCTELPRVLPTRAHRCSASDIR